MKRNLLFMLTGIITCFVIMYGYGLKMSKEFDVMYDKAKVSITNSKKSTTN